MPDLYSVEQLSVEAPSIEAGGLAEVVDMAGFVRQRQQADLLAAIDIVTAGGEPEGRARTRYVALAESRSYPGQIPSMLEATRAAVERQANLRLERRERQEVEQDLLDRAALLDLPDHWLRLLGIRRGLTVDEAAARVQADLRRRHRGLPPNTMMRNWGQGVIKFAKERGML